MRQERCVALCKAAQVHLLPLAPNCCFPNEVVLLSHSFLPRPIQHQQYASHPSILEPWHSYRDLRPLLSAFTMSSDDDTLLIDEMPKILAASPNLAFPCDDVAAKLARHASAAT